MRPKAFRYLLWFVMMVLFNIRVPDASSDSLNVWRWVNPLPTGNPLSQVNFLNDRFVAVGAGPTVLSSLNGSNWHDYYLLGDGSLSNVTFGNGIYAAVGSRRGDGLLLTSADLAAWSPQPLPRTNELTAVAFGNATFVAVGSQGTILSSSDGTNWIPRISGTAQSLTSIAFGGGKFLALANDSFALVSSDGASWTSVPFPGVGTKQLSVVTYINGRFYAGGVVRNLGIPIGPGPYSDIFVSTDGAEWGLVSRTAGTGIIGLDFGMGRYLAVDVPPNGPSLLASVDGTNFSRLSTPGFIGGGVVSGPKFGNGVFVIAGGFVYLGGSQTLQYSSDATNWTSIAPAKLTLVDMAFGKGTYVAVGDALLTSSNGSPFVTHSPTPNALSAVRFGDNVFHAIGNGGVIIRSTNGIEWVQRSSGTVNHLRGLAHGNGLWVAVGNNGTVTTSPVGQAWTLRFSGTTYHLNAVIWADRQFVAVGEMGTVITSPDGINWTVQFTDWPDTLRSVSYGNGQYLAVGDYGAILSSPDAVNWTERESGVVEALYGAAFGEGSFVVAGSSSPGFEYSNCLITSEDGDTWVQRDPITVSPLRGAAYLNGDFFVMGYRGAILRSSPSNDLLLDGRWTDSGVFEVIIRGAANRSVRLQSCDYLGADSWADLMSFSNSPSPITYTDSGSTNRGKRFYRAISP